MNRRSLCSACLLLLSSLAGYSQSQLRVYHGRNGETRVFGNQKIKLEHGETVTVEIVNANPLFYNYELKSENIVPESEDKQITELLAMLGSIISSRAGGARALPGAPAAPAPPSQIDIYVADVNTLIADINLAKQYLAASDVPEDLPVAMSYLRTGGFRQALDLIAGLPNTKFHFNSTNLLTDLNTQSDQAAAGNTVERDAFRLLNASLVAKVKEIKDKANPKSLTVWKKTITVSDTAKEVSLFIDRIDKDNNSLIRDGIQDKGFSLRLATIIPYYKRAALELVPVANFIFAGDVREYYLADKMIQNRRVVKTTLTAGAILNVNFAQFGPTKEMAVGIGPGYKFNSKSDALENFYLSTLFSYKNFLRIGVGFGFAQFPADHLKGGATVGQPLPSDVSNLEDLIEYEEKPSAFLTLSFTGLNLTKKK